MSIDEGLRINAIEGAVARVGGYFDGIKQVLDEIPVEKVVRLANIMLEAYQNGCNIFIMGNGGSAATASHIVVDINKGVSLGLDKRFKMACLNDNVPTVMAYANDLSYEDIFVEQLRNFLRSGDVVIGISGSGNSENVLRAIRYANEQRAVTVGLSGFSGGKLAGLAKHSIVVPVHDMQKTEDVHMMIGHILMQVLHEHLHAPAGK